jgi:hypothetical protein
VCCQFLPHRHKHNCIAVVQQWYFFLRSSHSSIRQFLSLTLSFKVLSLVPGSDGNVQFLQAQPSQMTAPTATLNPTQTYITLPITIPPAKPGDATQTFQIQVLNPNPVPQPKFQIPIGLQQHGTTVLTVAYSPQDGEILPNQMPDGTAPVTVLAAIQPQDLQLLAQQNGLAAQHQLQALQAQHHHQLQSDNDENVDKERRMISIKSEPNFWGQTPITISAPNPLTTDLSEYFQARSLNMQPCLKFNTEGINIKKELFSDAVTQIQMSDNNNVLSINNNYNLDNSNISNQADTSGDLSGDFENSSSHAENGGEDGVTDEKPEIDANGKVKKKRKVKKKPPKPKRPKPGQVHIATAIDGTVLFCCPECTMAYEEKESLEQHLAVHKIERRYVSCIFEHP